MRPRGYPRGMSDSSIQESVELVRRAQRGERSAFERLLDRYYPRVLEVVRHKLGPELRSYTESTDVVQETMGQVLLSFDRFEMRDEEALVRWISGLVENRLRDMAKFHRRAQRDRKREVPLAGPSSTLAGAPEPAQSAVSPLEALARREQSDKVRSVLEGLPEEQREILQRRNNGETWEAVAEGMGLGKISAARTLHAKATMALMRGVADDTGHG